MYYLHFQTPIEHATLFKISVAPKWSNYIVDYLTSGILPEEMSKSIVRTITEEAEDYVLIEDNLYRRGKDDQLRMCATEEEYVPILEQAHLGQVGRHFFADKTAKVILVTGIWWPTLFMDAEEFVKRCDAAKGRRFLEHRPAETTCRLSNCAPSVRRASRCLDGLGCMGLSAFYQPPVQEEVAIELIKHAINSGVSFLDTSDMYGPFTNEVLVGKAMRHFPRERIQLATKFGGAVENGAFCIKGSADHVRKACEASLKRLDVDYIDLYYQHRVDQSVPIEETVGELRKLVEEGKGCGRRHHSNMQRTQYIGIVAYSRLGRGFFSGKAISEALDATDARMVKVFLLRSLTSEHPEPGVSAKNKVFYERIANLAKKHGCTPGQLALAWVLHQGEDIVPIPGTTKTKNFDENLVALKVKLSKQDIEEISAAVPASEFSSSFHPQTDGQSEIAYSVGLDLLKSYISDQKTQWERYLPLVEFAYNNTIHSSTGKAPFEIVEGVRKVPPFLSTKDKILEANEYTRDLDTDFAKVRETLQKSQEWQKKAADRHRRDSKLKENDWVLLRFDKARL
ncbi:hypothetical protein L7F22_012992 [Adiantum nelumboides]|nr:hypothetical protein [Adiantum nelumboides]